MEQLPDTVGNYERALEHHKKGLRLVPCWGKSPFLKGWQHLHLGEADIAFWTSQGANWAIVTGDVVVLDVDLKGGAKAEAWVKEREIDSSVVVHSGGGGRHYYFLPPEGVE